MQRCLERILKPKLLFACNLLTSKGIQEMPNQDSFRSVGSRSVVSRSFEVQQKFSPPHASYSRQKARIFGVNLLHSTYADVFGFLCAYHTQRTTTSAASLTDPGSPRDRAVCDVCYIQLDFAWRVSRSMLVQKHRSIALTADRHATGRRLLAIIQPRSCLI